jgi:hypothetical protein
MFKIRKIKIKFIFIFYHLFESDGQMDDLVLEIVSVSFGRFRLVIEKYSIEIYYFIF